LKFYLIFNYRKEGHKAPMTGKTDFYDFDNWYKGHFERSSSQQMYRKQKVDRYKEKQRNETTSELHLQVIVSVMFIIVLCNYSYFLISEEYSTASNATRKSAKKED